ncbi:cysteine--tRNA ligase [Sagittula stellata]|uniref:Cysteine--tRNA ligase n=1 Tax=Sagittula stellata (strain ATCC 700073 / DSM 11524 / E-37) TaxID=388399 RepID=A3JYN9_SAGS3|nr:cysteine--tRNA ligase [Sagittula stellata]EBA09592.1 Cysteinyl-tRNA synthetase, class Ia [Sagittula stellata E-37]
MADPNPDRLEIRLTNTRNRAKEVFVPIDPENVRMYVCGPTVYDRAHLGNARPVLVFDVLYRLLRHVYGADHVTYVRNFTDVDDKINATALARKEAGADGTLEDLIRERTEETISWYLKDMGELGALEPDRMPRATEYIAPMVAMIEGLIESGHAYAAEGHVLFRVRSYEAYGKLSGRSVDDMMAGARVEVAPYKEDPMDFVLWKPSSDELPGWDSPWGRGRPGWHIECSAMSYELFGSSFDIHGGGNDLMFPHHENEIAQSCCAHPEGDFAKVWMHNEMLQVEGRKMSKSLGNFFTVRDLLDQGVPGEVIRFVMLSTHYRKPMDWTAEKAREAKRKLAYWRALLKEAGVEGVDSTAADLGVVSDLAEDLNTKPALDKLGSIADYLKSALVSEKQRSSGDLNVPESSENSAELAKRLKSSANLLGLLQDELADWFEDQVFFDLSDFSSKLVNLRAEALAKVQEPGADKKECFRELDRFKSALLNAGVEVRMSKAGVELVPGPDFDPAKLEQV